MISGGATPPFYYAFMCEEYLFYQRLYLGLVWVCSSVALFVALHPRQRDFNNNWILALSFIIAGYSSSPGVLHLTVFMQGNGVRDFPFVIFFLFLTSLAAFAILFLLLLLSLLLLFSIFFIIFDDFVLILLRLNLLVFVMHLSLNKLHYKHLREATIKWRIPLMFRVRDFMVCISNLLTQLLD